MPLTQSQGNRADASSPSFCAGRKLSEVEQALLWTMLQEDSSCPSRELLDNVATRQEPLRVSLAMSTGGGPLGGSMVAKAACAKGFPMGLWPVAWRSSRSYPGVVCRRACRCSLAQPTRCLCPSGSATGADRRSAPADAARGGLCTVAPGPNDAAAAL